MLRIVVSWLLIFFNNASASSWVDGIIEIGNVIKAPTDIHHLVDEYKHLNMTRENIEKLLRKAEELASQLRDSENHMNLKCDNIVKSSVNAVLLGGIAFQNSGTELCHNIAKVNNFFVKLKVYKYGRPLSVQTFKDFAHKVLWDDDNLPDLLDDIRVLFVTNMLNLRSSTQMFGDSKEIIEQYCDSHASAQQQIYNIYMQLFMAEMKGLITIQQIYLTKRLINETTDNYFAELDLAKMELETRLSEYHEILSWGMQHYPQHIRRCDVKLPRRGVNIIELQNFSRISILDLNFVKENSCGSCPSEKQLHGISVLSNTTIYNCKDLGTTIKSCPSMLHSHRDYLWWQDIHGTYYGHHTSCDRMTFIDGGRKTAVLWGLFRHNKECDVCACSVDQNRTRKFDDTTIWRISVTDQISDLSNNMVVTGVRLITYDNALHLQIRQSNFSHSAQAYSNSSWKKLDLNFVDSGLTLTSANMSYEPLGYNRKTLYLDDIRVPDGYVVTGVRFRLAEDSAFKLQILATSYEFGTGDLFPLNSTWLDAPKNATTSEDYKRERIEINLDHSDDPTRNERFEYYSQSNKMVTFTHTDLHKDAGQTTIPLLDAQPVITQPPFPLGGIGLSYRGKDGFGGYVAPRIYTIGVMNYMKSIEKSLNIEFSPKIEERSEFVLINNEDLKRSENTKYTIEYTIR